MHPCPNCKRSLDPEEKFCPNCGFHLNSPPSGDLLGMVLTWIFVIMMAFCLGALLLCGATMLIRPA
jgi:predicted amidophosphoribosyltransferase